MKVPFLFLQQLQTHLHRGENYTQLFFRLLGKENTCLQLYVRLLIEEQILKLGMVTPTEKRSDFFPLFPCYTLHTCVFFFTVANQMKINFLPRSVILISRSPATHDGEVHPRLGRQDRWVLLNLEISISMWWERWHRPHGKIRSSSSRSWDLTSHTNANLALWWTRPLGCNIRYGQTGTGTPVWKYCSVYSGVEKSNGYWMKLWEATMKTLSTYFLKFKKPCCMCIIPVIFLLQME